MRSLHTHKNTHTNHGPLPPSPLSLQTLMFLLSTAAWLGHDADGLASQPRWLHCDHATNCQRYFVFSLDNGSDPQQHGRAIVSSSYNNLVATSPPPSNKIQGICHGAASCHSASSRIICAAPIFIAIVVAVACPPTLLP